MSPNTHQDSQGRPVQPGDLLSDSFVTVKVVRLYGVGQFVHAGEFGELVTNFCCCFTVCTPPAQHRPSESLAAPVEAGQVVCSHLAAALYVQDLLNVCFFSSNEGSPEEAAVLKASVAQDLRIARLELVA